MEFLSKSVEETAKIAADLVKKISAESGGATIIGLYGDLGSGKTTFIKYMAETLGVEETIQSPTFVIEKIYDLTSNLSPCQGEGGKIGGFDHFIHIDTYRIETDREMLDLGWLDIITNPKNLICVEWPERIAKIMPKHIMITFEHVDENSREINIES